MTTFPDDLRPVLALLAEEMIPAGAELPSANDVGISTGLLDAVLHVRPDLADPLAQALEGVRDTPPGHLLAAAERDPTAMEVLGLVVAGGYLMSAEVAQSLRYPWQEAKPVRSDDVFAAVADGLLDAVVERGPIYRAPPTLPTPPHSVPDVEKRNS